MPSGLPITRPSATPWATGSLAASRRACPSSDTPAANRAKIGTATPAEIGRHRCSTCAARQCSALSSLAAGIARPSTTPAIVAWTPDACMNPQLTRPSGTSSHPVVIRRLASSPTSGGGGQRRRDPADVDRLGVHGSDHDDREQVVDHRQGQQEGSQRVGQASTDDREHGDRERDVRRGRHGPAARLAVGEVDQQVEARPAPPSRRSRRRSAGRRSPDGAGRRPRSPA